MPFLNIVAGGKSLIVHYAESSLSNAAVNHPKQPCVAQVGAAAVGKRKQWGAVELLPFLLSVLLW